MALLGFAIATGVLIFVTPYLVRSSTAIAAILGVSTGFVGATLVAVVTSLPEMVTTIAAVRIGAYDMAIGNLFGSNAFNIFALGLTDFFYKQGYFLANIDDTMLLAAILGLLLTAMGLFGNVTRFDKRLWIIEIDSSGDCGDLFRWDVVVVFEGVDCVGGCCCCVLRKVSGEWLLARSTFCAWLMPVC